MIEWCRYTDHGREHVQPRVPWRIGRIVPPATPGRHQRPECVYVLWNGAKTVKAYHRSFITVFATSDGD